MNTQYQQSLECSIVIPMQSKSLTPQNTTFNKQLPLSYFIKTIRTNFIYTITCNKQSHIFVCICSIAAKELGAFMGWPKQSNIVIAINFVYFVTPKEIKPQRVLSVHLEYKLFQKAK